MTPRPDDAGPRRHHPHGGADPDLADLLTIEQAARRAGMHRQRVRDLAIAAGIAVRWGGTDAHPRLKVRWSEVKQLILSRRYVPPATPKRQQRKPTAAQAKHLDPLVRC